MAGKRVIGGSRPYDSSDRRQPILDQWTDLMGNLGIKFFQQKEEGMDVDRAGRAQEAGYYTEPVAGTL